jgi:thioredoxin-like negative regulator of GroEL
MSIPSFVVFKNGQPVDQMVGGLQKEKLQEMIERNIGK